MNWYRQVIRPILFQLDSEHIHERTIAALELAQRTTVGLALLHSLRGAVPLRPVTAFGLTFPNPLGVAAGFDKDVRVATGLAALGFGHVEVGTLTPWQQGGNPRPRIFRLPEDGALINRMGFPNGGIAAALPRLRRLAETPRDFVLGISLGKQKETPLEDAASDYVHAMNLVYGFADYLAINISSPNTPGLRALQGRAYLDTLLGRLAAASHSLAAQLGVARRPLLVKIAPDLTSDELDAILGAALDHDVAGIIAGNTTISRAGLRHANQSESGGLSGDPLAARSTDIIRHIRQTTGDRLPVIGVGGIRTVADAQAKLDAGASLLQLYTGLVYEGPGLAGRLLRGLADG